ncbi:MAG: PD40 domain-containing protein [Armatimonadetes bacterium]|nr:PD40 domain-containing protein [Armatimonadota bacterium]
MVVAYGNKTATLRDLNSQKVIFWLIGSRRVITSIAFSPDGKRIVTTGFPDDLRVWSADTGKELLHLPYLTGGGLLAARFSADGKTILAGSRSGEVREYKSGD